MLIDFRQLDNDIALDADICIIGAGAAGITLAWAFRDSPLKVILLESGGLTYDADIQSLCKGESVGRSYFPLDATRLRYFGGSTNHWGGWCAPLQEMDFEPRSWVSYSGWPIRKQQLDPYYETAQQLCQLGPYRYQLEDWTDEYRTFPPFHHDKVQICFWQLGPPTRFGQQYRDVLEQAKNVRVYLYANVAELVTNEAASQVQAALIRTLQGKTGTVRARVFILACGGIENARLLLLSRRTESHGLGNRDDLVGRFFMDHPHAIPAVILATEPRTLVQLFTVFTRIDGSTRLLAGLSPSPAAQVNQKILNSSGTVDFKIGPPETGYDAYTQVKQFLQQGEWPDDFAWRLWRMVSDLDDVFSGAWRPAGEPYVGNVTLVQLFTRSEQEPNPNSRITLSHERDSLGLPQARLDWRLTELDKRSVRIANRLLGEEFGRLGLGRLRLADWLLTDDSDWSSKMEGGNHHMGTTRMADDPRQGVVDRNCQVHGIGNFYIAGSSVFPTSGYANPTLTLVALALRLADYVKQNYA
jgi:choline dehydrogenase-like flavoprotein